MFKNDDEDILEYLGQNNEKKTRTINTNKEKKYTPYLWIIAPIILIMIFLNIHNKNILIGEWKPAKKSFINFGNIEFTKDRMIANGFTSKVEYEILDNKVIITDETETGLVFKIINEKTIYNKLFGKYNRVK